MRGPCKRMKEAIIIKLHKSLKTFKILKIVVKKKKSSEPGNIEVKAH